MIKKLLVITVAASYLMASHDVSILDTSKNLDTEKQATTRPESRKMALDFTPLPYDLQKLVLGYISSGWQITKTITYGAIVDDLFYSENNELLAEKSKKIFHVDFERQVLQKTASENCRFDRHDEGWPYAFLSKHYRAVQEVHQISFKTRRLTYSHAHAHTIVSEIMPPNRLDNNPFFAPHYSNVQFSPCEKYCAVSARGEGQQITLWDLQTGRLLQEFAPTGHVTSLALSVDGKNIAAGFDTGKIILYQAGTIKQIALELPQVDSKNSQKELSYACKESKETNKVNALALSNCGQYIASGTNTGTVYVWENQPDVSKLI